MLEGRLKLGDRAQHMNFAGVTPLLERWPPFRPVFSDVLQFRGFAPVTGSFKLNACPCLSRLFAEKQIMGCESGQRAIDLVESFERRLDARHGPAVELHLFAHMPVQRAR